MASEEVKKILEQRGSAYGPFFDNAGIAQTMKEMMRLTPNWRNLTPVHREALDLMALKVSRILSSDADPHYADNWNDIAGYASLAARDWSIDQPSAAPVIREAPSRAATEDDEL